VSTPDAGAAAASPDAGGNAASTPDAAAGAAASSAPYAGASAASVPSMSPTPAIAAEASARHEATPARPAAPACAPASAGSGAASTSDAASSPQYPRGLHWLVSLTPGSCVRLDPNVGSAGFCGEVLVGLDAVVPRSRVHLDAEVGAGIMPSASQGYADLGVAQSSGGGYGVVRAMVGYDFAPLLVARLGAQVRTTYSLHWLAPGIQAVADLGTRVGYTPARCHVEVGVRTFLGADGIAFDGTSGPDTGHAWSLTFAYGATLLLRYVFR
jgi:hypothetical protein